MKIGVPQHVHRLERDFLNLRRFIKVEVEAVISGKGIKVDEAVIQHDVSGVYRRLIALDWLSAKIGLYHHRAVAGISRIERQQIILLIQGARFDRREFVIRFRELFRHQTIGEQRVSLIFLEAEVRD